MDAPLPSHYRSWGVALALTLAWSVAPVRADPLVTGLADEVAPGAGALREGGRTISGPVLASSPVVTRPASEIDPGPQGDDESEEVRPVSPVQALVVTLFMPSYYANALVSKKDNTTTDNTKTDNRTDTIGDSKRDVVVQDGKVGDKDSTVKETPEPATLISGLLGLSVVGFGTWRRRRGGREV
jgi:hypothetical protein